MTLLLRLRDRAKNSRHGEWRQAALNQADAIQKAIEDVHDCPTDDHLAVLNGLWAVAHRILNHYPDEPEDVPPRTNVMELNRRAA